MAARSVRCRNWNVTSFACIEWNTWYEDQEDWPNWIRAIVWQPELTESTSKEHIQCFIQTLNPITARVLRARLPGNGEQTWTSAVLTAVHVKRCVSYCSNSTKTRFPLDGDEECRVWPSLGAFTVQGTRTDLANLITRVRMGASDMELLSDPVLDTTYLRFHRHVDKVRSIMVRSIGTQERDVCVFVHWGDSGSGKSRYARDEYQDIYTPPLAHDNGALWFDGYTGQQTLLLEDFEGNGEMSIRTFLRLTDRYPLPLQFKGGTTYACWSIVVITSNKAPDQWWGFYPESVKRRLHVIKQWRGRYPNAIVETWPMGFEL